MKGFVRYLVTGHAQVTIAANYRMSPAVVRQIIHETCLAVWDALHGKGLSQAPKNEAVWERIANKFELK